MTTYLDTSFLLKLYVYEPESATALLLFSQTYDPAINTLTDVEMASALFRKLPASTARAPYQKYLADRKLRLYRLVPLAAGVYRRAQSLAEQYSGPLRLRSLDLLHLSTAVDCGASELATYDKHLAAAAQQVGLSVIPARP